MADPTKYSRGYSFSNYQANTPNQPLPGTRVDVELDSIADRLGGAIDAITDVRRSDGKIKAGAIDADSFDADLLDELLDGAVEAAENSADAAMASQIAAAASETAADASADAAVAAAATSVANAALLGAWRGAWVTATAYAAGDRVSNAGNTYYATSAHTSAALFSTDLSALKWGIVAEKGAAGAGTGDVLAANNGSDFDDKPATLATLGGQPLNANLTAEAGLTGAADRVSYFTGVGAKALATFTSFARTILDDANAATVRATLELPSTRYSPSGVAELVVPLSTSFKRHVLHVSRLKPSVDGVEPRMQISTDGGSSWVSTGDHFAQWGGAEGGGAVAYSGTVVANFAIPGTGLIGNQAGDAGLNMDLNLADLDLDEFYAHGVASWRGFAGTFRVGAVQFHHLAVGVNALRLYFNGSNILSGNVTLESFKL
jgi:hypothetical protein